MKEDGCGGGAVREGWVCKTVDWTGADVPGILQ